MKPGPRSWTCIADESQAADGQGIVFAATADRAHVTADLARAGYATVTIDGSGARTFRDAQALVAHALHLPESAATNLDALSDCLRDPSSWPEPRLALLWDGADALITRDLPGWYRLTDVLGGATDDLWRDEPGDKLFETVLFLDGFGEGTDA